MYLRNKGSKKEVKTFKITELFTKLAKDIEVPIFSSFYELLRSLIVILKYNFFLVYFCQK